MSPPESNEKVRGIAVVKPKADIYTVLLGISLLAVLLAILCLTLELRRYKWDYKAEAVKLRAVMNTPGTGLPGTGPALLGRA